MDKFIDSDGEDHLASFSPNGQSIAFVSSRLGIQQLFISGKGHDISLFSNPDNLPIYRAPVLSKQGDKLAFSFANNLFIYSVNTKNLSKIVMPATFTSVLDWFVDGSRLLIATKKENVSYFSQYDLDNQTTIDMVETGVNYSARLSNTDKLVFYKDGILHWGTREFLLNALPPILGSVYPMGDELIFQSGRQIIRFDGNRYNVMIEELPQEGLSIADIHNAETLLLNSSSSHSAKIVALE